MTIVSIGEILWDVIGEKEHLGGAPFNFAVHAARLGHELLFVSGVGDDARGRRAIEQAGYHGIATSYIKTVPGFPTGVATVEIAAAGQPDFHVLRPAAYDQVKLAAEEMAVISRQQLDWIYFGTLHQVSKPARQLTEQLIDANPVAHRFYDVNLRPDAYAPDLVEALSCRATVAKLNEQEASVMARWFGLPDCPTEHFCRRAASRFGWKAVAITRGAEGCTMLVGDDCHDAPGVPIEVADTVGAGDAFAAAFLHGLDAGWDVRRIAAFANQVGAFVASRPGATPVEAHERIQPEGVE